MLPHFERAFDSAWSAVMMGRPVSMSGVPMIPSPDSPSIVFRCTMGPEGLAEIIMIDALINSIRTIPDCVVQAPSGLPSTDGYALPEDLKAFYTKCGGIRFFIGRDYPIAIVPPAEFVRANPVIAAVDDPGDRSDDWFIVAKEGGQYVTLDLNPDRHGRCYDSFWDRHAVAGSSTIIASSFTDLLQKIASSSGDGWFWLAPDFLGHGDAYDD